MKNHDMYKVLFFPPFEKETKISWFSIETAGKIRFSGARKSVILEASPGERCTPQNFVHLVTFRGTSVHLIV